MYRIIKQTEKVPRIYPQLHTGGHVSSSIKTLTNTKTKPKTLTITIPHLSPKADTSAASTVNVEIVQTGSTQTAGTFTYDPQASVTPVISSLSQTTSPVWGTFVQLSECFYFMSSLSLAVVRNV